MLEEIFPSGYVDRRVEVARAGILLALEMTIFWEPGMSAQELYTYMQTITTDQEVLMKATAYWASAMIDLERRSSK
jgi:hypothetical protein